MAMLPVPAPTHDLVRLRKPTGLRAQAPLPRWVGPVLERTPWVVVQRGYVHRGVMPVAVRGVAREQRFAAFLPVAEITDRLSPEILTYSRYFIDPRRQDEVPALAALSRVAPLLTRRGYRWGPGGSVAFEMATRMPAATPSSDLDLILRQERRLEQEEAIELLEVLTEAAAPARADAVLETPRGGVSLAELAAMAHQVIVRTPEGARLSADPWMVS
jgi:phosphoribosyl-dephospho-CoA transferase